MLVLVLTHQDDLVHLLKEFDTNSEEPALHPSRPAMTLLLAPIELSPQTVELRDRSRTLARRLFDRLEELSEPFTIRTDEALVGDGWLFVDDGFVKLIIRDRTVRYYEAGDLLRLSPEPQEAQLESEFRLRGRLLSSATLDQAMASDPEARRTVIEVLNCEARLLASLCAEHASADRLPPTQLTRVAADHTLLREGEHSDAVYMLIEGSAVVTRRGVKIGYIAPCEMAGEMSLLSGGACTATVITETPCLLQVIQKSNMADVVRNRPETVLELAKTLAERLLRANEMHVDALAGPTTASGPNTRED